MRERDELVQLLDTFFRRLFTSTESEAFNALADLSFTQVRVAMFLACVDEPTPINEIASGVGMSMTAVGRALDRMVELGLVERREDRHDRRVRLISLSADGHAVVERHFRARREGLAAFVERLPDEQVGTLAAALEPILVDDDVPPRTDGAETPHS